MGCYKGEDAIKYEHAIALKTESLSPAHTYVPWVVANGVHNDKIQNAVGSSLLKYVCDNFTGTKSKDCPAPSMSFAIFEPVSTIEKCYRFEEMTSVESFLQ